MMRFVFLTFGLLLYLVPVQAQEVLTMAPETAYSRSTAGELLLIDVRRPTEWEETGIAESAVPLSMHGEHGLDGLISALETLVDGDKSRPIAVICRSGTRSARVADALIEKGYTQIHDVGEGMVGNLVKRGWIKRGLPIKAVKASALPTP